MTAIGLEEEVWEKLSIGIDANFLAFKVSTKCWRPEDEISAALGHPSNPMIKYGL
jgi:hypothetical protein